MYWLNFRFPRLDALSPVFLYVRLLTKADEILIAENEGSIAVLDIIHS
jgi:hypothetical protein